MFLCFLGFEISEGENCQSSRHLVWKVFIQTETGAQKLLVLCIAETINELINHLSSKSDKIWWFRPLRCEHLLLFFVLHHKLKTFGFVLDVILGRGAGKLLSDTVNLKNDRWIKFEKSYFQWLYLLQLCSPQTTIHSFYTTTHVAYPPLCCVDPLGHLHEIGEAVLTWGCKWKTTLI